MLLVSVQGEVLEWNSWIQKVSAYVHCSQCAYVHFLDIVKFPSKGVVAVCIPMEMCESSLSLTNRMCCETFQF